MAESNHKPIETGQTAPDFCLPSSMGGEVCISDYQKKSQVFLFFVREFG